MSSKDRYDDDLSVVLMQNAFEIWHFADASCSRYFMLCLAAIKSPTSTMSAAIQADLGWPLSYCLLVHCCSGLCSAICQD